jgi:cold shock CspA family protein
VGRSGKRVHCIHHERSGSRSVKQQSRQIRTIGTEKNDCNVPIRCTAFPPGAWVNEGQMVSYDVIQGTKGPHAANIRLVINTTPKASSSLGR